MSHTETMGAPADMAACPLMPNYGPPSIMFVRGEGTELWDRDGKRYLDFVGGLAVQALGHAHPEVADAIAEQAGKLVQVSNLWATEHAHEVFVAQALHAAYATPLKHVHITLIAPLCFFAHLL